jgi:tetratricopeptide (TPR) repeat protein
MGIQKVYYHDWLPNTYYLKLNSAPLGQRLVWGVYVLCSSLTGIGLWLVALVLAWAAMVRSKTMGLLSWVIIAQIAYLLYVGGDAWEWWGGADRYLCTVLPLFFILAAIAIAIVCAALPAISSIFNTKREACVFWGLALLTIVQVNSYQFTSSCSLAQWLLVDTPAELKEHAKMLRLARLLRENTTPEARIAVVWAGVIPYFSERQAIDFLGKNDRTVAKGPDRPYEKPPMMFFASAPVPYCWPGHTKRDYSYSIGKLSPDVIAQQWYDMSTIAEMLGEQYVDILTEEGDVFVKKTTPNTTGTLAPYMDLGNALFQRGKLDEAAAMYQKALDFGFGIPLAHNNLGLLAVKRGHTEDAIAHYQKSLAAQPDFFDALVNLAGVYGNRGQYDEALSYFQKALAADPNHAKTRTECDRIKALQEQARQSLAKQRESLKSKPTDVALLSSIAWTLATHPDRTIRNGAEAVPLAEQAVELSQSKDPVVLGTLAAAYAEAGRFADATSTARKALEIASQQNKPALVDAFKAKISLYENKTPFRDFLK